MAEFEVDNNHLLRSALWSSQIKEALMEDLMAMRFVSVISEAAPVVAEAPMVSLPVAVAMGTAAVIIKNPVVSRRFWQR